MAGSFRVPLDSFPAISQVGSLNAIPRDNMLWTSHQKLLDPERMGGTVLILIL